MRAIYVFIRKFWLLIKDGDMQMVAASLSYATVLSIVPFLAVGLATLQWVDALDFIYPKVEALMLSYFQGPVGSEGLQLIRKALIGVQKGHIGIISSLSLFLASSLLLHKIEVAVHRIWNLKNRRPLYGRIFIHWLVLILFPFLLAIFVALTSAKFVVSIFPIAIWHLSATFLGLTLLYKFVPNIKVSWVSCLVSSMVATVLLTVLFKSFKVITKMIVTYNKFYGSLAAIPAFLIFVLFFWYIVLLGTTISVALNKRAHALK
ncbi:MAG: YihY/virulence factor BrkB family protein [Bdellovibrionota bacterium]